MIFFHNYTYKELLSTISKLNKNVGQHLLKRRLSVNVMCDPLPANFECEGDKNRNSWSKFSLLLLNPYGRRKNLSCLHRQAENQNINKRWESLGSSGAQTNPITPIFYYIFRCVLVIPATYPKINKIVGSAHCGRTSLSDMGSYKDEQIELGDGKCLKLLKIHIFSQFFR